MFGCNEILAHLNMILEVIIRIQKVELFDHSSIKLSLKITKKFKMLFVRCNSGTSDLSTLKFF